MATGRDDPPIAKAFAFGACWIVVTLGAFHLASDVECGFVSAFVGYEIGFTQNAPHRLES